MPIKTALLVKVILPHMNPASLNMEFYPDLPMLPALEMQVKGMSPVQMLAAGSLEGAVSTGGIQAAFFESKFRNWALDVKSLSEMLCCSVESQFRRASRIPGGLLTVGGLIDNQCSASRKKTARRGFLH